MYKVSREEEGGILDWRYQARPVVRKSIDPEAGYSESGLVEV